MIPFKYTGTSIKRRAKGLAKYVRYNEVFVISRFFSIYFLLLGLGKSFVIQRFIKSRFPHCIGVKQRAFLN